MPDSSASLSRRFWVLAGARTASVAGNGFGQVALAFGVLSLPRSGAGELSLVMACQALPQVLFVLIGGVVADRMSRARLMLIAEVTATVAWSGLAVVIAHRTSAIGLVCVLAVLAGLASALFAPAFAGVVPDLVPPTRLHRANAMLRVGQNTAGLVGFGLAGITVATFGAGWALAIDAASFAASGLMISTIRIPNPPAGGSTMLAELREGARDFFSRQWLWVVVAQFAVVVAAVSATNGVLGPLVAQRHFGGSTAWSLIVGAQALGSLAGAGIATRVRARRPIFVAVLATFVFAAPMLLLALAAPIWECATTMFLAGVATDIFSVLWSTTMQTEIPPAMLSRVSAYDIFGSVSCAPLGLLLAGPLALAVGSGTALFGCAAVTIGVTAAALSAPQVRSLRARSAVAAEASGAEASGAEVSGAEASGGVLGSSG